MNEARADEGAPAASVAQSPAGEQVTEFDISKLARRLGWLRFPEIFLIYIGLVASPLILISIAIAGVLGLPDLLLQGLLITFGVMAYRDSGKLKPRIWRWYRFTMPAALLAQLFLAGVVLLNVAGGNVPAERPAFNLAFSLLVSAVACAVGAVTAFRLLHARLDPTPHKLADLIDAIDRERRAQPSRRHLAKPINRPRGIACLAGAAACIFVPKGYLDLIPFLWEIAAIFLLFRSRQYFQPSAESLLHEDTRKPILFLRSFADDPTLKSVLFGRTTADEMAGPSSITFGPLSHAIVHVIDYSIETRLANHFMDFGPFIAVGSPQEKLPQIGAARAHLSDSEWQAQVAGWMETSSTIVVVAGSTKWILWELRHIVEGGHPLKLILLWPRPLAAGKKKPKEIEQAVKADLAERLDHVKEVFAGSPWEAALARYTSPEGLLAMRFYPSGALTVFKSERRNNDAFQLAVELLHMDALKGEGPAGATHLQHHQQAGEQT